MPTQTGGQPDSRKHLKILSLSCLYPNSVLPGQGLFVRSRLRAMSKYAELAVLSPLVMPDYAQQREQWFQGRKVERRRRDGELEVWAPHWWHPPRAGALNPVCLAAQALPTARRLHRERRFDLIDAHFAHPDGIAAAMLAGALRIPFTVTIRGSEMLHSQFPMRRRLMAWALRRALRVIAVSERLRQFAISLGVPPENTLTIPNGVDATVFHPLDRAACRARYNLAPDARVILSAGHLFELKGHHRIVRALQQVPGAILLIAGDTGRAGDFSGRIRQEIEDCAVQDRVRLLGHVNQAELAELMNAADVFCLASSREGWPNVLHEALSCGTPVVATDVGAVPEMVPSENLGRIVTPNDVDALGSGLRQVLDARLDRQQIAAWGQNRSWDSVGREVIEALTGALAG